MGWRDEQRDREERHVAAVEQIEVNLRALHAKPAPEHRPGAHELRRFPALRAALACCRDVKAGEGLAELFRRVPDEYVNGTERVLSCVCGASVPFGDLQECPGACGRYFASDGSGAWAAKFDGVDDAA